MASTPYATTDFYVVNGTLVYGELDTGSGLYPLLKISVDAEGAYTILDTGSGIDELPAGTLTMPLWMVARKFQITVANPYEPVAAIASHAPVSINLDTGAVTVVITPDPAEGAFTEEASSATGVCTVSESGGTFTLTPVAAGTATITALWTPTNTDLAASEISFEVTVVKRTVTVDAVRDYQIVKGEGGEGATNAVDIPITVLGGLTPTTVEAYVSDGSEVEVSVTGNVITVTPSATYVGKSVISVWATKANCNAMAAAYEINVEVCATQTGAFVTTPSAVSDKKHGETETLTFAPAAGASIVEFNTSDASHVAIQSYNLAAGTCVIEMVGVAGETANITATAHKRGLGQKVSGNVAVTIAAEE